MNSIILRSFIIYACVCGILGFIWTYYDIHISSRKDKLQDKIAETAWATGFDRGILELVGYLLMLFLGWVFFPYKVLHRLGIALGIVKEEEEE